MPKTTSTGEVGYHYGRRDMDRIGIFNEESYLHGVSQPPDPPFWKGRGLGVQMESGCLKVKTGLQDCYFDKTPFRSINVKDPYRSRNLAIDERDKNAAIFKSPGIGEWSSGPGDFYGTFAGRIDSFSPALRPRGPFRNEPPNVKTSPGKKGSYGYYDVTINKFPEYMPQGPVPKKIAVTQGVKIFPHPGPFYPTLYGKPYFDPNPYKSNLAPGSLYVKRRASEPSKPGLWYPPHVPRDPANNHDGCFSPFPKHMPDPYKAKKRASEGPTGDFWPPVRGCAITKYTTSIANHNVDFRVNAKNWRIAKPFTYKIDTD